MQQQKENRLVSSPVFSISWWWYRRSCSSEAQKQWHTLWNHILLMLVQMRIIISNTTGPQYVIWNVNVILDKVWGIQKWMKVTWMYPCRQKSLNAFLCNADFPHFPRRGFCRSCQHSAEWSRKWYCLCCCHTALPIRSCARLEFVISGSPINQSILFCSFSTHKSILFLRLDGNNRPGHTWIFWMISNIRHSHTLVEFLGFESRLICSGMLDPNTSLRSLHVEYITCCTLP